MNFELGFMGMLMFIIWEINPASFDFWTWKAAIIFLISYQIILNIIILLKGVKNDKKTKNN